MTGETEREETKPFPGSPTGNQSGVGEQHSPEKKPAQGKEAPTENFPGSPTGNASGVPGAGSETTE